MKLRAMFIPNERIYSRHAALMCAMKLETVVPATIMKD